MGEKIRESQYGRHPDNFHIERDRDTLTVELTYPEIVPEGVKYIQIDQESVRASDGFRCWYDYDRDGWVIEQPAWVEDDEDPPWRGVAFIQSWALGSTNPS